MIGDGEFHRAARDGYLEPLVRATRRDLNSVDEDGMTPTLWAAASGNLEALRKIVGRGGHPDKCDLLGYTAIHHASKNGHYDVVSFLVNYGANIWSMDNDYHTAMDIASIYNKDHIVKFLDEAHSHQQQLNPGIVKKLREKATEETERNIKEYERRTKKAQKLAEKEQRRLQETTDPDFKAPTKTNFFKTLTLKLKGGNRKYSQPNHGATTYSDLVGTSKRGVQRKILQKQTSAKDEFKISEIDEDGNRMVKSVHGTRRGTDIMYMTSSRDGDSGNKGIRPAIANVFPGSGLNGQSSKSKWKSESDLIDSGIDSVNSATAGLDDDDGDEEPGVFNRPGFGKMSFLHTNQGLAGTLNGFNKSASLDMLESIGDNESENTKENRLSPGTGSIGSTSSLEARMDEGVPWEEEDVQELDDDDDESEFSPLVRFLESCGLASYTHLFTREDTDLETLLILTDADFKELGLPLGPRRKLQEAVKHRKESMSAPKAMTDSYL